MSETFFEWLKRRDAEEAAGAQKCSRCGADVCICASLIEQEQNVVDITELLRIRGQEA